MAILCGAVPAIEKFVAVAAVPLSAQVNVSGRLAADEPVAVKLIEPLAPINAPLAAGDCDAQVGGTFRTTVHDWLAVLDPLLAETVSVLLPGFNDEDNTLIELAALPTVLPFNCQVRTQLESLGVMPKVVLVDVTLLTRVVLADGTGPLSEHAGNTVTAHLH